ncbi:unnamed protein product [Linum trigynum]|uniref:Transcription repressor n=1 Tax=Linum trigynum TaxID=586398 RepID=A0AAV2F7H1_9ROSI
MAVTLDSRDPLEDFRESMAEMVEAHGLRDWESLEKLLGCYLTANEKSNHDYIVATSVICSSASLSSPPLRMRRRRRVVVARAATTAAGNITRRRRRSRSTLISLRLVVCRRIRRQPRRTKPRE